MIVNLEQAEKVYNLLPPDQRSFYFHPEYLKADVRNKIDLELRFFIIQEENSIFYHAFYLGKIPGTELYDIQSPYGYGGPIIVGNQGFKEETTRRYKQWCMENGVMVEFIRFHPLLKNQLYYEGEVYFNRKTICIDLQVEDIWKNFSSMARRAIRKAIKSNVKIIFSKEPCYVADFAEIYEASMKEKNAGEDYIFDFSYYKKLLQHDQVILVSAVNEVGETLASSLFFMESDIIEYHLSATTEQGKTLRATNLIIYTVAQYSQRQGGTHLYLGGGSSTDPQDSLLFFKESFSKKEIDYYIGSNVYVESEYKKMKKKAANTRVLFYR